MTDDMLGLEPQEVQKVQDTQQPQQPRAPQPPQDDDPGQELELLARQVRAQYRTAAGRDASASMSLDDGAGDELEDLARQVRQVYGSSAPPGPYANDVASFINERAGTKTPAPQPIAAEATRVGAPAPNPSAHQLHGAAKLASDVFATGAGMLEHPEGAMMLTGLGVPGVAELLAAPAAWTGGKKIGQVMAQVLEPDAYQRWLAQGGKEVADKEALTAAAQLAVMGLPVSAAARRVLQEARVPQAIGSRATGILEHAIPGAAMGAAFTPDNPAAGAVFGATLGGTIAGATGGRTPGKVRVEPQGANLADHPERLLSTRAPIRTAGTARVASDATNVAPEGPDYDVQMNTPGEALEEHLRENGLTPGDVIIRERDERRAADRAANTDALTGLGNQRAYTQVIDAAEQDPNVSIIRFDLNGFKAVNDIHGHEAGDAALQSVAQAIRAHAQDLPAFRVGGDEFAVIAPKSKATQLRDAIEREVGVVTMTPEEPGAARYSVSGGVGSTNAAADAAAIARKALHKQVQGIASRGAAPQTSTAAPADASTAQFRMEPITNIDLNPGELQYKLDTNEQGETGALKGARWNPALAGVLTVARNPTTNRLEVINGHQRYGLAARSNAAAAERGEPLPATHLPVREVPWSDYPTMRGLGALINIAEGSGTPVDAAKFFRDTNADPSTLEEYGINPQGPVANKGMALAQLHPALFQQVINKTLPVDRGVVIGGSGLRPDEQLALTKLLRDREQKGKRMSNEAVSELIRFVKNAGTENVAQESLFGTEHMQQSLAPEKADLSAYLKERLAKDRRVFGFVAKGDRAQRIEGAGVGKIETEKAQDLATRAAQAEEVYHKLSTMSGPVSDALTEAARSIAKGGDKHAIRDELYRSVSEAVRTVLAGAARVPEGAAAPVHHVGADRELAPNADVGRGVPQPASAAERAEGPAPARTEVAPPAERPQPHEVDPGSRYAGEENPPALLEGAVDELRTIHEARELARDTLAHLERNAPSADAAPKQRAKYQEHVDRVKAALARAQQDFDAKLSELADAFGRDTADAVQRNVLGGGRVNGDDEEPGFFSAMRTGEGTVGAGFDKSLFKKLGANMYKGDLGVIAVKEALQNAVDSIRPLVAPGLDEEARVATLRREEPHGAITINFEKGEKFGQGGAIQVHDTGRGMTPEVMESAFVDVGGSAKDSPESSGGYGLAKVALFSRSQNIFAQSVARREDGKLVQTTIVGSGHDWVNGTLEFNVEVLGQGNKPTGTELELILEPDVDVSEHAVREFMRNAVRYSTLPVHIHASVDETSIEGAVPAEIKPEAVKEWYVKGANMELYESATSRDTLTDKARPRYLKDIVYIHVLNRGLYQFTREQHAPGKGFPSFFVLDITPTVDVENQDYPFTTSREELKKAAAEQLNAYIQNLQTSAGRKELEEAEHAFRQGGVPTASGDFRVIDDTNKLTPAVVEETARAPWVEPLLRAVQTAWAAQFNELLKAYPTMEAFEFGGMGVSRKWLGLNVGGQLLERLRQAAGFAKANRPPLNKLFFNPFTVAMEVARRNPSSTMHWATLMAKLTWATGVHEIAHQLERGHQEGFAGVQTRFGGEVTLIAPEHMQVLITAYAHHFEAFRDSYVTISAEWARAAAADKDEGKFDKFADESRLERSGHGDRGHPERGDGQGRSDLAPLGGGSLPGEGGPGPRARVPHGGRSGEGAGAQPAGPSPTDAGSVSDERGRRDRAAHERDAGGDEGRVGAGERGETGPVGGPRRASDLRRGEGERGEGRPLRAELSRAGTESDDDLANLSSAELYRRERKKRGLPVAVRRAKANEQELHPAIEEELDDDVGSIERELDEHDDDRDQPPPPDRFDPAKVRELLKGTKVVDASGDPLVLYYATSSPQDDPRLTRARVDYNAPHFRAAKPVNNPEAHGWTYDRARAEIIASGLLTPGELAKQEKTLATAQRYRKAYRGLAALRYILERARYEQMSPAGKRRGPMLTAGYHPAGWWQRFEGLIEPPANVYKPIGIQLHTYATSIDAGRFGGPVITHPVYANIQRPLRLPDGAESPWTYEAVRAAMIKSGHWTEAQIDAYERAARENGVRVGNEGLQRRHHGVDALRALIMRPDVGRHRYGGHPQGFDGLVYRDIDNTPGTAALQRAEDQALARWIEQGSPEGHPSQLLYQAARDRRRALEQGHALHTWVALHDDQVLPATPLTAPNNRTNTDLDRVLHPGLAFPEPSSPARFKEEDLFGNPVEHDAAQGSLFGAEEGTTRKRSLADTERAAQSELEQLRAKEKLTTSPIERVKIARRIAELEKLVNRDKAISEDELRTRARAEHPEGDDLFGGAGAESPKRVSEPASGEHSSANAVTISPAFRRWFGDSKVIDADGNPLVVHHGTGNPTFTRFLYKGQGLGKLGHWFSSTQTAAERYATVSGLSRPGAAPGTIDAYLSIQHPKVYDGYDALNADIERRGAEQQEGGRSPARARNFDQAANQFRRALSREGYDGVIVHNAAENGGTDYVVFKSSQIKSASRNSGDFSPDSNNILYGVADPFTAAALMAKRALQAYRARKLGHSPHPMPNPTGMLAESKIRPREIGEKIVQVFAPELLGSDAKATAGNVRHVRAVRHRAYAQAVHIVRELETYVDTLSRADQIAAWDAYEKHGKTGNPTIDAAIAGFRRVTNARTRQLIQLDRLRAERAIENYVGRFWSQKNNEAKVATFLRSIFGRRPFEGSKSFLKARALEYFVEGLDAGLVPPTYNFVTSQLAKLQEMERLIGAELIMRIEKRAGRVAPVGLGQDPPIDSEGRPWIKIDREGNDPAFSIYGPPETHVWEGVDAIVYGKLRQLLIDLGIPHNRLVNIGGERLGYATPAGKGAIVTKFGGPEGVVMHELGHILDHRYGLRQQIEAAIGTAPKRTVKKGKNQGKQVPDYSQKGGDTKEARVRRARLREELRRLANLRRERMVSGSQQTVVPDSKSIPTADRQYLHSWPEKMANMVNAYIANRRRFQDIAPGIFEIFDGIVSKHPELHALRDIEPSLSHETHTATQRLPGPTLIGHYYAPRASAAVWANHLSKGMRGNPIYDALTAPGIAATQMLLGISGFHGTVIATEGLFSEMALAMEEAEKGGSAARAARALSRSVTTPVETAITAAGAGAGGVLRGVGAKQTGKGLEQRSAIAFASKIVEQYRAPGTHPELERVLRHMIAGGFRAQETSELWTGERVTALKRAVDGALLGDNALKQAWAASKIPLDALYAGIELLSSPLLSKYVPLMKTATTYQAVAKRLAELEATNPMLLKDLDRVHAEMWDIVKEMDYRFGQVIYDNHFVNAFAKHLAQALFLAPGWTFGTLALAARGGRDFAFAPKRAYDRARGRGWPEQPILGRSGKYWVAAVVGTAILCALITWINTGTMPGDDIDDRHDGWKDFFAFRDGTYDVDGNPNRHTIPGYLMHDIYGWGNHPVYTFSNKLSPFFAFGARALQNRNYFDDLVYNPEAPLSTKADQIAREAGKEFLPLSVQNYLEARRRSETGPGELARNLFGVTPAKREFVRTPAQNQEIEYVSRRGHAAATPEEAQARDERQGILLDFRAGTGDVDRINRAIDHGELTEPQLTRLMVRAGMIPFQERFKTLTLEQKLSVFNKATPSEQAKLIDLIDTAIDNASRQK